MCYSAGAMVLSKDHPRVILYRSPEPVLTPLLPQERQGTIANVVFPTGIDRRDDIGLPDRFDVYYGMADKRIGVARLDLPDLCRREQLLTHRKQEFKALDSRRWATGRRPLCGLPAPNEGRIVIMKSDTDIPRDANLKPAAKPESKDDLKSLPMPEVERKLGSSPEGLTQAEAQKRLTQYGPNEIEEKKTNPFLKFLTYFWGPIPWMIEAAVILSGVVRHWPDFFIILLLLVSNAVVGFWEERQAGNAIAALKAKLAIKARVKRDGKWTDPAARELVPGDVIRLRLGDIVPADARLLAGDPVEVDQSALTGESLPAERKPGEAVFSGSIIRQGEIEAMVYATGGEHLLRQDRAIGAGGAHRQPFPACRAEDRRLPDRSRGGSGGGDYCRRDLPWRPDPHHVAVRPGADRGRDSRGHAHRAVRDHGGRRTSPGKEGSDCDPARRLSRNWPAWTCCARTRPAP